MNRLTIFLLSTLLSYQAFSYEFEEASYYMSGGLGASVNAVRHDGEHPTPSAAMPFYFTLDYVLDKNIGFFGTFAPQFSGGAISFLLRGGMKYWFTIADTPYVPYVSLAFAPQWLIPTNGNKHHLNLGVSPGLGINYFIFADFIIGLHVNVNPSVAFVNKQSHFEFSVNSILDLTFRI